MKDASAGFRSLQLPGLDEVTYTTEYRSDQNPRVEARPDGNFRVILSSKESSPEELLKEKENWIHQQQTRLAEEIESLDVDLDRMLEEFVLWGEPFTLDKRRGQFNIKIREGCIDLISPRGRDGMAYLKNWVKDRLREKVTQYAGRISREIDAEFNKVYIRNQRTKWASCSSKSNLSFNIRSAFLPPEHLEYLIAHEVVHLKHPHHKESFWNELESINGGYEKSKDMLDGYWLLSNRNKVWKQLTAKM